MNNWANIYRKYPGKWVAIEGDNTVVASGSSAREVKHKADEKGFSSAGLFHVPQKDTVFVG